MTSHIARRRQYLKREREYLVLAGDWDSRAEKARTESERRNAQAVATTYRNLADANRLRGGGRGSGSGSGTGTV
ncbi:MAG TPA: hypothetical protein VG407_11735 [Caulobacteraceae bacterium]|jgi:hypothetical protein|nr:hypothetical protein [Caulobacteraceae bacterium]